MKKAKKRVFAVIVTVVFVLFMLASTCGGGTGGTNVQTPGVDESDIVKITADGHIIKVQSDGLSIVKTIVEQHSGTVAVKNVDNGGASFIISLPNLLWR